MQFQRICAPDLVSRAQEALRRLKLFLSERASKPFVGSNFGFVIDSVMSLVL